MTGPDGQHGIDGVEWLDAQERLRYVVVHEWPFCSRCLRHHTRADMQAIHNRKQATSGALGRGEGN